MNDYLNNNPFYPSSGLYSPSNFFDGIGSAFNIGGNYYVFKSSKSSVEADLKAIRRDWEVVGEDLRNAINSFNPCFK